MNETKTITGLYWFAIVSSLSVPFSRKQLMISLVIVLIPEHTSLSNRGNETK